MTVGANPGAPSGPLRQVAGHGNGTPVRQPMGASRLVRRRPPRPSDRFRRAAAKPRALVPDGDGGLGSRAPPSAEISRWIPDLERRFKRLLHLVEARRVARGLEMTVDEYQQLVLLARQHDQPLLGELSQHPPRACSGTKRDPIGTARCLNRGRDEGEQIGNSSLLGARSQSRQAAGMVKQRKGEKLRLQGSPPGKINLCR